MTMMHLRAALPLVLSLFLSGCQSSETMVPTPVITYPPPAQSPAPIPPAAPLAAARATCTAQEAGYNLSAPLVRIDGQVNILTVGSSSTEGIGASAPTATYPAVLERLLNEAGTGRTYRVTNKGVGGQGLAQIQDQLPTNIATSEAKIIVLQTGTIEAMYSEVPVVQFQNDLLSLVSNLKQQDLLVILIDSQYAPQVISSRYVAVQEAMLAVADATGVPLIKRYALQERWLKENLALPTDYITADGLHMNDFGYECIAMIARDIILGVLRRSEF